MSEYTTRSAQPDQTVDGFADTTADDENPETPDNPDYGNQGRAKPLTEEERMQAEREINEEGDHNRISDRKHE